MLNCLTIIWSCLCAKITSYYVKSTFSNDSYTVQHGHLTYLHEALRSSHILENSKKKNSLIYKNCFYLCIYFRYTSSDVMQSIMGKCEGWRCCAGLGNCLLRNDEFWLPELPIPLAVACLILNFFIPGSGEIYYIFIVLKFSLFLTENICENIKGSLLNLPSLKWHYAQFALQKMGCNSFIFHKIAIYND